MAVRNSVPANRGDLLLLSFQDFENSLFRVYGPEQPAFDGSWKPGDFEQMK
jgi:hypothetical protein